MVCPLRRVAYYYLVAVRSSKDLRLRRVVEGNILRPKEGGRQPYWDDDDLRSWASAEERFPGSPKPRILPLMPRMVKLSRLIIMSNCQKPRWDMRLTRKQETRLKATTKPAVIPRADLIESLIPHNVD